HARLSDFIVDALAICAGIAMAATIEWLLSRSRPQISCKIPAEPRSAGTKGALWRRSVDDADHLARARLDDHAAIVD
ncbi:hypothetical protein ABTD31_19860, partial [Acinetobacter baumannii]